MKRLLQRTFAVEAAAERAWAELVAAEQWPRWARHLRSVQVTPPGPVGPASSATLKLTNHTTATVRVTKFQDGRRFRWEGSFLWLGLGYDHLVSTDDTGQVSVTSPSTPPVSASTRSGPSLPASTPATWTARSPDCRPSCDHLIRHGPRRVLVLEEPTSCSTRSVEAIPGGLVTAAFGAAEIGIAVEAGS